MNNSSNIPVAPQPTRVKRFNLGCVVIGIIALLAVALLFLISATFDKFRVENSSNSPTLMTGDYVLARPLVKPGEVERGDIVIFHFPLNPREDYIKRVIGLPGEVVSIQNGKLLINGQLLNEPYISEAPLYSGTWTVPEGQLFLLGDDRNRSSDSHTWGFVPFENVVSKVQAVYYPLEHIKILNNH